MNTLANRSRRSSVALLPPALMLVVLFPSIAAAHVGTGPAGGWLSGLAHPLGGLDHLSAMIGVGLWAAQRGGRALWLMPLAFLGVMALGGFVGMAGYTIPMVETGIVASVLILGCLIAAAVRLPLLASTILVGLFALLHGHAHGLEAPDAAAGLLYGLGFLTSSALLVVMGVGLGWPACRRTSTVWLARYAGAAIALCGVYLWLPLLAQ
jgi:urease accessory protein